jgi:cleavage stimulation factor subunit 3
MADEEAEQAFFRAQALESDTAVPANEEQEPDNFDDEDEYDPSRTFDDQYQDFEPGPEQTEEVTEDEQLQQFGDNDENGPQSEVTPPNQTISSDIDTGFASDAPDPAQNSSRAESQTSTPVPPTGVSAQPQTRTIGGFDIEDDEDEVEDDNEEADYEPPAVLGVDDSNAMPMTMSEDPSSGNQNHTTSPDVSSHMVQPSASVLDVANSSYSPAIVSNIDPSVSHQWVHDPSVQNSTAPTPVPDSPSSKGRLAHDRVGILQDRVDEDPRGDLSAWLELIAEHRARNRLDSAREVYERFLKEFPMAVSCALHFK